MFKFGNEQKIFEVGGVRVGGQPGELPTVLIGSLFHEGHKIVKDRKIGVFDRREAERLIEMQAEMSERTGLPYMLDVVAENPEALIRYVDFVSEVSDAPFLINGSKASVRVAAAHHAVEAGLEERSVYNSINYTLTSEEAEAIKETGLKAAIVQAFNLRKPTPQGMVSTIRKLLHETLNAGIEKPLALTPVLDVPSIGFGVQGIRLIKEEFGIPTGTAPVGVVGRWSRVKDLGALAKRLCRVGTVSLAQAMGADFIIYGSVAKARDVFPVAAMIDAIIAYNARTFRIKPLTKNHPLYKIF